MNKRIKLFIPFTIFIVIAAFFLKGLSLDPNAMPSALIDESFPEFQLPSLKDQSQILQRTDVVGQVALVNVWASWCVACKYEHPVFNALAEKGVRIIGLNYKDNVADATQWLAELGNPYVMNVSDRQGTLGIDLGVFGAPETYLIDPQGVIRYKHVGIVDMKVWNEQLQPLYQQYTQ